MQERDALPSYRIMPEPVTQGSVVYEQVRERLPLDAVVDHREHAREVRLDERPHLEVPRPVDRALGLPPREVHTADARPHQRVVLGGVEQRTVRPRAVEDQRVPSALEREQPLARPGQEGQRRRRVRVRAILPNDRSVKNPQRSASVAS